MKDSKYIAKLIESEIIHLDSQEERPYDVYRFPDGLPMNLAHEDYLMSETQYDQFKRDLRRIPEQKLSREQIDDLSDLLHRPLRWEYLYRVYRYIERMRGKDELQ